MLNGSHLILRVTRPLARRALAESSQIDSARNRAGCSLAACWLTRSAFASSAAARRAVKAGLIVFIASLIASSDVVGGATGFLASSVKAELITDDGQEHRLAVKFGPQIRAEVQFVLGCHPRHGRRVELDQLAADQQVVPLIERVREIWRDHEDRPAEGLDGFEARRLSTGRAGTPSSTPSASTPAEIVICFP